MFCRLSWLFRVFKRDASKSRSSALPARARPGYKKLGVEALESRLAPTVGGLAPNCVPSPLPVHQPGENAICRQMDCNHNDQIVIGDCRTSERTDVRAEANPHNCGSNDRVWLSNHDECCHEEQGGTLTQAGPGQPIKFQADGYTFDVNHDSVKVTGPCGEELLSVSGDPHLKVNGQDVPFTAPTMSFRFGNTTLSLTAPTANSPVATTTITGGGETLTIDNATNTVTRSAVNDFWSGNHDWHGGVQVGHGEDFDALCHSLACARMPEHCSPTCDTPTQPTQPPVHCEPICVTPPTRPNQPPDDRCPPPVHHEPDCGTPPTRPSQPPDHCPPLVHHDPDCGTPPTRPNQPPDHCPPVYHDPVCLDPAPTCPAHPPDHCQPPPCKGQPDTAPVVVAPLPVPPSNPPPTPGYWDGDHDFEHVPALSPGQQRHLETAAVVLNAGGSATISSAVANTTTPFVSPGMAHKL